jgi:hypothetical protein
MSNQEPGHTRGDSGGPNASAQSGGYESWEHFNILIDQSLAKYLYAVGDGDLSAGIMMVARFHREKGGKKEG